MSLETGQRLGGFEVLGPLGSGGMGEVYRARDTRLGREVALKVLPDSVAADRARLSRFEQEARAASALNHPHIVTIHEIGRDGDVTFIAMELVDGKTLRELSASGPMPVKKILNVAAQISEGLAKAHGAGIVHRDLKPENVMVSKDGFVKILDFGLAKLSEPQPGQLSAMPTAVTPQTTAGTVLGTVAYMSPEQASGEPLDYRSDQFSLGSMLYEMSTGKKAFQRKTAAETMSAIIREEPEPAGKLRPDLPLPVRWVLERCMAKDPEDRYAATRDLARDLSGLRDHISEATSGAEAMLAPSSKARRRYTLPLVLAALAAGIVASWGVARSRASRAPSMAPTLTRLTFRRGGLGNARFAPDGKTIVFGARWAGETVETKLYRMQIGSPESSAFDFRGDISAISPSNELAVLDLPPGADQGTLSRVPMSGGTPRPVLEHVGYAGADFSPDGKDLAVDHTVDGQPRLEFPIGKVVYPDAAGIPRVSRDGRSIAFWDGQGPPFALAVIGRDGGKKRVLSGNWTTYSGAPCWSADGREVWFTAAGSGGTEALRAVDLSGKQRLLMRTPGSLELDDVSRDGRVLVAHHTVMRSLRVASRSAPEPRELSWLDASFLGDLSADGKLLLMTEFGEGSGPISEIYLRRTDGSPAIKLGEGGGFALSPDGKWVLAERVSAYGKMEGLLLLPTGPGGARTLDTTGITLLEWGAWLPDGKRVVIVGAQKDGGPHLYL
jgi:eukaryotic-like serine/threonine-protein kinase